MEKYITDERTELRYELVGDYCLIAMDDDPEVHIGAQGQRYYEYLRQNKRVFLSGLQLVGKVYEYLADIDRQAENMFARLVNQMAEREGVTEKLKAEDQMEWVVRMNNIRCRATEIVNRDIIYS